jgi:DNA-binding CsgD family transcriptional regulator
MRRTREDENRRRSRESSFLLDEAPGPADVIRDTAGLADRVERDLRPVVPFDWHCVGITDPSSGLVTMVQNCTPIGPPEVYLATELFIPDFNKFAFLAGRPDPVGVLSQATDGDLQRSHRYRHALRPSGIEHELRAALVVDGECWGYLVLLRGPEWPDFTPEEVTAVRSVVPELAAGLRTGLLSGTPGETRDAGDPSEPGVAIVGKDGTLEAANPLAQEMFDRLAALHPAVPLDLPVPVAAIVASLSPADTVSRSDPAEEPTRRVLLAGPDGAWLSLTGTRVTGRDGDHRVVVTLEPARPMAIASLLLQHRGLTEREIAVARCVLIGMSTAEIAEHLAISAYTVQDHLKAVFAKTGVRSRRELARAVLPPGSASEPS